MGPEYFSIGVCLVSLLGLATLVFASLALANMVNDGKIAIPAFIGATASSGTAYALIFHSNPNFQEGLRVLAALPF